MSTAYADEVEVVGKNRRRAAPKRGSQTKRNLDKKVTIKESGKRGPKASSNKHQINVKLEPNVLDALLQLEGNLRATQPGIERNDVIRLLLATYASASGSEPIAPDIDPADTMAGRSIVVPVPMKPDLHEFFEGSAKSAGCSIGHMFETMARKAVKFDSMMTKGNTG